MYIKKISAMIITVTLALTMTACGGDNEQTDKDGSEASATQTGESTGETDTLQISENNGDNTLISSVQNADNIAFAPDSVKQPDIWEVLPEIPVTDAGMFKYEFSSELGGIIVTNYLGDETAVRIPDTFDDEPVVKVDLKKYEKALTEIILPDSVKSYEFSDDIKRALQYINIPAGNTDMGDYKFNSWNSLIAVYIPDGISVIGKFVINGCESLVKLTLPGSIVSIGGASLINCASLTEIYAVNGVGNYCSNNGILYEKIENGGISLRKCPAGKTGSIVIPEGVTEIYKSAFDYCQKITDVTLPASTKVIGDKAFCDCIALTNVTLSDGIVEIGYGAFKDCTALSSVTIPDSVTKIDKSFLECRNIQATYKGTTYDYEHIKDLYNAINGN